MYRRGAALLLATASVRSSFRPEIVAANRKVFAPTPSTFSLLGRQGFSTGRKMPLTVLTTEDSPEKAAKVAEAAKVGGTTSVSTDEVKSYYWWEGKVNFDPEWRVAVTTTDPFTSICDVISKSHSYDLPMIIYDIEGEAPVDNTYWKGVLTCTDEKAATELAKVLVEQRLVACAQATPTGGLAVKTVIRCKGRVEESAAPATVTWSAISGNEGYLKWMVEECVAAKAE